ncbi:UxaA family hydrolase [Enterocloster lavalensis]|uniref:UxaA family hydrolase n=1 Tax=Enterocloster lavalensis TaxID=460384 RepID=UPI0026669A3A|nr:altronate dehydratase family protein [Enterocloster lavalensis]
MQKLLQIREEDAVAVALAPIAAGEIVSFGPGKTVTARESVRQGHKIALRPIPAGTDVIKYGCSIGGATADIEAGQWVHTHNMKSRLTEHVEYAYEPDVRPLASCEPETFMGYRREDGRAGIRNEIWIIPGVGCVDDLCMRLAVENQELVERFGLDGLYAFPHPFGCSQLGEDNEMTRQLLASLVNHPNAGAVLVVSLGCENNVPAEFKEAIIRTAGDGFSPDRVKFLVCQEVEDEVAEGSRLLVRLAEYAGQFKRKPIPASELVIGMKCGGSDGLSGVTANPVLGQAGDMLVARGGSTMITEVPEMFGAEQMLLHRCVSREVFDKAQAMLNEYRDYFVRNGQPVYGNPAPGNYEGGISSLEDKSCGCVQKGGRAPIEDVIPYAGQIRKKGLTLLAGPGSDLVSATNLTAAGAHIVIFTTGRGTPYSTAAPTIKVSTNTPLYEKKRGWMDFNAGVVAEGMPIRDAAEELYRQILRVAGGEQTKGEAMGYRRIAIFKNGVIV